MRFVYQGKAKIQSIKVVTLSMTWFIPRIRKFFFFCPKVHVAWDFILYVGGFIYYYIMHQNLSIV